MKICFNALGPDKTICVKIAGKDKLFINGSIVETENEYALSFIKDKLAFEIKNEEDEEEALAVQRLEQRNVKRRFEIQRKAEKMRKGNEYES